MAQPVKIWRPFPRTIPIHEQPTERIYALMSDNMAHCNKFDVDDIDPTSLQMRELIIYMRHFSPKQRSERRHLRWILNQIQNSNSVRPYTGQYFKDKAFFEVVPRELRNRIFTSAYYRQRSFKFTPRDSSAFKVADANKAVVSRRRGDCLWQKWERYYTDENWARLSCSVSNASFVNKKWYHEAKAAYFVPVKGGESMLY